MFKKETMTGARLFLGDVSEVLKFLHPTADFIYAHPPYSVPGLSKTEYIDWQIEILNALYDCSTPHCSMFYQHKVKWSGSGLTHPYTLVSGTKWSVRQELIWDRGRSSAFGEKYFAPSDERIYWLTKGDDFRFKESADELMESENIFRESLDVNGDYPFSVPVSIPEALILKTTNVSDVVFDPFMGSGTTAIAALKNKRQFIGVEISEDFYRIALDRIEREIGEVK